MLATLRSARLGLLCGLASAIQVPAQQSEPVPPVRIGVFFWHDSPNDERTFAGVRDGLRSALREVEFVERRAGGDRDKAKKGLFELRDAECRLLLLMGTQAALLAQEHVPEVPRVFTAVANPVASQLCPDWKTAGSAVAGASYWIEPAAVLAVFRLAVPGLHSLGMLRSKTSGVVSQAELAAMRALADGSEGVALELIDQVADDVDDIERATRTLLDAGVQAIWIPNDFTIYQNLAAITKQTSAVRVPLVTTALAAVRSEAVVSATVDFELHGRRTAALLLRVLDGHEPASLPIDTMQSFRIVANLDAARRARIELPLSLLVLADELIHEEARDVGPR